MRSKITIILLILLTDSFALCADTARDEFQHAIVISASVVQPFETTAVNILSPGKKYILSSIILTRPQGSDYNSVQYLDSSGYTQLGQIPALLPSDKLTITITPDNGSSSISILINVERDGKMLHSSQERIAANTALDGQCIIGSTNACIKITNDSELQGIGGGKGTGGRLLFWALMIILADTLIVIHFIRRRKEERKLKEQSDLLRKEAPHARKEQRQTNKIRCFGEFQIFNSDAEDMAQRMSPILKELLILFICNRKEGLTSEKIRSLLWSEKSDKEARNSRNVYITKLRHFLAPLKMDIIYEQGKWTLSSGNVEIDLWSVSEICDTGIGGHNIEKMLNNICGGKFLEYINYDWLYKYKEDLDDVILLSLTGYMSSLNIKDDPQMIIRIADAMFIFDSLNEQALMAKCKSLKELAKHTVARQIYWLFCKEYRELYGEEYDVSFSSIMTEE